MPQYQHGPACGCRCCTLALATATAFRNGSQLDFVIACGDLAAVIEGVRRGDQFWFREPDAAAPLTRDMSRALMAWCRAVDPTLPDRVQRVR